MPIGYWESEHLLAPADLTIIGSGIVGMSTALHYKKLRPFDKVRIMERDPIGEGGTTRNAGFACFGGPGEWLDDLDQLGQEGWLRLVEMRIHGLSTLLDLHRPEDLELQWTGGWELFNDDERGQLRCKEVLERIDVLNSAVQPLLESGLGGVNPNRTGQPALEVDPSRAEAFGAHMAIHLPWEGMLHTGKLVSAFHAALEDIGVQRLHGCNIEGLTRSEGTGHGWSISTPRGVFESGKVAVCTNGFAQQLLPGLEVHTAPNRVLVIRPDQGMPPTGCYHVEDGYLYFRTLADDHVLFGGGRQFGIEWPAADALPHEFDAVMAEWDRQLLESARRWMGDASEVTHRWTGWLGVGKDREPLIGSSAPGLHHAVRMGGMGIAVGSGIGKELARRMAEE